MDRIDRPPSAVSPPDIEALYGHLPTISAFILPPTPLLELEQPETVALGVSFAM